MDTTHTWDTLTIGETMTFKNVTLQTVGGFGVSSYTCKEVELTCKPYAQYPKALEVMFLEKGKRNRRGFTASGDHAFILIVPQVAEAKPADPFSPSVASGGMIVRQTRYSSYDSRYQSEHLAQLDEAGVPALFYLCPQERVTMPTMAEIIDQGTKGFQRRVVPIAELASVAEVTGRFESMAVRKELRGQPVLRGYGAPMWGGPGLIRYESMQVAEVLSV